MSVLTRSILAMSMVALASCAKPEPPKLTPESAKLTAITPNGVEVEVKMKAENPNDADLDVESVSAHVVIDATDDLGTVDIASPIHLPANKTIEINVPVKSTWGNLMALAPLAQKTTNVPFEVSGKVKVKRLLEVDIPFTVTGTITRAQLLQIAQSAIPKIPGVTF